LAYGQIAHTHLVWGVGFEVYCCCGVLGLGIWPAVGDHSLRFWGFRVQVFKVTGIGFRVAPFRAT
jgi:hypothetical protein